MTRRYCPCYRYCLQSHPSSSLYLAIYRYLQHTPAVEQLIRSTFDRTGVFCSSTSLYLHIFVRSYIRSLHRFLRSHLWMTFRTTMDDVLFGSFVPMTIFVYLSCYRAPLVPMDLHQFFVFRVVAHLLCRRNCTYSGFELLSTLLHSFCKVFLIFITTGTSHVFYMGTVVSHHVGNTRASSSLGHKM